MTDQDKARFQRYAEWLRELKTRDADEIADAFEAFSNGSKKTLNAAFNVKGKVGRPTKSNCLIARNIKRLRDQNRTWEEISLFMQNRDWPCEITHLQDIEKSTEIYFGQLLFGSTTASAG